MNSKFIERGNTTMKEFLRLSARETPQSRMCSIVTCMHLTLEKFSVSCLPNIIAAWQTIQIDCIHPSSIVCKLGLSPRMLYFRGRCFIAQRAVFIRRILQCPCLFS